MKLGSRSEHEKVNVPTLRPMVCGNGESRSAEESGEGPQDRVRTPWDTEVPDDLV